MSNFLFGRSVVDAARAYPADDPKGAVQTILARSDKVFHHWAFAVAALGFLTDSYNLFASNVILPAISFVYWPEASARYENAFNIATLIGTIVGQLGFGWYADRTGRQAVFGYELLLIIISTLGLLQSSQGFHLGNGNSNDHTWDMTPWLFFWRICMGIGIGAAYPLSAVLAAEWSPTHSRARTMGLVFLMQPVGQALACFVGWAASALLGGSLVDIDRFWRIVVGVGAGPTLLTIVARFFLPESWRYSWYVAQNPRQALLHLKGGSTPSLDEEAVQAAPMQTQENGHLQADHQAYWSAQAIGGLRILNNTEPDLYEQDRSSKLIIPHITDPAGSNFTTSLRQSSREGTPSRDGRDSRDFQPHHPLNPVVSSLEPHTDAHITAADVDRPAASHMVAAREIEAEEGVDETDEAPLPRGISNLWTFLAQDHGFYMKRLLGASISWFLLDYAFYGMGFMSPATIAKLWEPSDLYFASDAPWWQITSDVSNITLSSGVRVVNGVYANDTIAYATINVVLYNNVQHVLLTTSIAAVVGGLVFALVLAPKVNRKRLLMWTYLSLAVTLLAITIALRYAFHHGPNRDDAFNGPALLIAFWVLAQLLFSIGPNTLTFILPAEIFPTRYRCTCYGIAAAIGKLGAVVVQAIMWKAPNGPNEFSTLRDLMGSFAAAMLLGAIIAWLPGPFPHRLPILIADTQIRKRGIDGKSHPKFDTQNREQEKDGKLGKNRKPGVVNLSLENCSDDKRYLPAMLRQSSD